MYCMECGTKLPDTAKFCRKCGAEVSFDDDSDSMEYEETSSELETYDQNYSDVDDEESNHYKYVGKLVDIDDYNAYMDELDSLTVDDLLNL